MGLIATFSSVTGRPRNSARRAIASASRDKFWLRLDGNDPRFDAAAAREALEPLGPERLLIVETES